LVVVAGDLSCAPDDLAQWGCLVNVKIMDAVAMVADGVIHVLHKITTERDIDDLGSPADRQQRQVVGECDARHGKIKCVLLLVDPVLCRVRLLARPPGRDVTTARQQHTIGKPDPLSGCVDVYLPARGVRMHNHRLSAGRENGLRESSGGHFGLKA
jgi:hypothetical protein